MQNAKCKSQNFNLKFKNFKFYILIFHFSFYILHFIGCAPPPYVKPTIPSGLPGIYHRVEKGQTLWGIAKAYNIDLDEIVRINRISDAPTIEINQLIFIPGYQKPDSISPEKSFDDFIWPIKGKVIVGFGENYNHTVNKGINIQPKDNPNVVATRSGTVVFCAQGFGGFGKTIIIDHGDGFSTVYARNREVFIKAGDKIKKGMVIAKAGSSGRDKNIYLHFQIRKAHKPENPNFYLPR